MSVCQERGHAWNRVSEELSKAGPVSADKHFTCSRLGCAAKRTDHWDGNQWGSIVTEIMNSPPPVTVLAAEHDAEIERRRMAEAALLSVREAWNQFFTALADYFSDRGYDHDPGCPEDDTCGCPVVRPMRDGFVAMNKAMAIASDAIRK